VQGLHGVTARLRNFDQSAPENVKFGALVKFSDAEKMAYLYHILFVPTRRSFDMFSTN
jgi:hypothetical protein